MAEFEKKKIFWTSIPGILTGAAAMITAVGGLYIAIDRNSEEPASISGLTPPPDVKSTSLPNEWPLVVDETFTEIPSGWSMGSYPDEYLARFDLSIVGGKYRWDMEFRRDWESWVGAPYGPATDFHLAVDVKFVEFMKGDSAAHLVFAIASNKYYRFSITSNEMFGLSMGTEMIIDWTPISINPKEINRVAVAVEDQQLKLYLNSKLLGTYKDSAFTGGKVGLSVAGYEPGTSTIVDFDNFTFRRKP